jgi:hypothetical protein
MFRLQGGEIFPLLLLAGVLKPAFSIRLESIIPSPKKERPFENAPVVVASLRPSRATDGQPPDPGNIRPAPNCLSVPA